MGNNIFTITVVDEEGMNKYDFINTEKETVKKTIKLALLPGNKSVVITDVDGKILYTKKQLLENQNG